MKLQTELDQIEIPENIKEMEPMAQLAIYWGVIAIILKFTRHIRADMTTPCNHNTFHCISSPFYTLHAK